MRPVQPLSHSTSGALGRFDGVELALDFRALRQFDGVQLALVVRSPTGDGSATVGGIMRCAAWAVLCGEANVEQRRYAWPSVSVDGRRAEEVAAHSMHMIGRSMCWSSRPALSSRGLDALARLRAVVRCRAVVGPRQRRRRRRTTRRRRSRR